MCEVLQIIKKNKYENIFNLIILCVGIILLATAIFDYMKFFHNTDLAFNVCMITNDQHVARENLIDYRGRYDTLHDGTKVYYTDVYVSAQHGSMVSLIELACATFLIGISVRGLFEVEDKKYSK